MRKWWKNYRYRFTPYVRGDLTKMKNTRYADEGPLTSQAELCRQLNEVRRIIITIKYLLHFVMLSI